MLRPWNSEAQIRARRGKPVRKRSRFTLRLPPKLHDRCVDWAEWQGLAVTEWIRQVLQEKINELETKKQGVKS